MSFKKSGPGCCGCATVTVTLTVLKACATFGSASVSIFSGATLVASGTTSSLSRITVTGLIPGNAYTVTSPSVSGPRWATAASFNVPSGATGTVSITTTFLPGTGYVQGGPTGACTGCTFPLSDNMTLSVPGGPLVASYQVFTSTSRPANAGWFVQGPGATEWGNAGGATRYYLYYAGPNWVLEVNPYDTTTGAETPLVGLSGSMNCSTVTASFTSGSATYTATEATP